VFLNPCNQSASCCPHRSGILCGGEILFSFGFWPGLIYDRVKVLAFLSFLSLSFFVLVLNVILWFCFSLAIAFRCLRFGGII
jgi:hypothetical protein